MKIIEFQLSREDLLKQSKDKPIEDLIIYDFKPNLFSREYYMKADRITFVDDNGTIIELKNKY